MYKSMLIIALLTATAPAVFTQTTTPKPAAPQTSTPKTSALGDSVEQAVLQVTQEWLDADERHDRAALDRIIGSDFLGTAPGGRMVSKRDIIPAEGTTEGHSLGISAEDIKVRVFGDTAIVTARGIPKTRERAEQGELRCTVVFVKRDGRWQMVAAHLSPVPKQ